jgi:hypothetical protein
MATTRANVQHALATPIQLRVRPITLGLIALLTVVAMTVAIALAASGGGTGDEAGYTKSMRVAPSVQHIPTPAERNQDPGLNGPGMRP